VTFLLHSTQLNFITLWVLHTKIILKTVLEDKDAKTYTRNTVMKTRIIRIAKGCMQERRYTTPSRIARKLAQFAGFRPCILHKNVRRTVETVVTMTKHSTWRVRDVIVLRRRRLYDILQSHSQQSRQVDMERALTSGLYKVVRFAERAWLHWRSHGEMGDVSLTFPKDQFWVRPNPLRSRWHRDTFGWVRPYRSLPLTLDKPAHVRLVFLYG